MPQFFNPRLGMSLDATGVAGCHAGYDANLQYSSNSFGGTPCACSTPFLSLPPCREHFQNAERAATFDGIMNAHMHIQPHQWIAVFVNHHDWWSFVGNNKNAFGALSAANPCIAEITEYWQEEYEPCYGRTVPAKEKCLCLIDEWRHQLSSEYPVKIKEWDLKYNCPKAVDIITNSLLEDLSGGRITVESTYAAHAGTMPSGTLCAGTGDAINQPYIFQSYMTDFDPAIWYWRHCKGSYPDVVSPGTGPKEGEIPDTTGASASASELPKFELYNVWFLPAEIASVPFYTYTP